MKFRIIKRILLTTIIIIVSFGAIAHQPKLIYKNYSLNEPFIIEDPEISKAFYGKLTGKPHFFKIESNKKFLFYAGILSPKINDEYVWLSIDVIDKNNNIIFQADGSKFEWTPWYEPYARDTYWKGPEIGKKSNKEFKTSIPVNAGTYVIKVYNKKNIGHYSLAVGEAEFFGSNLWEQILTWTPILFYIGPYMDIFHWYKFDIRAYIPHVVLLVIIFILFILQKRIFKKNS
tara:strand:+ start:425 stop:1117 length:693 start_codon:yes stop_codon:yes gene_type:complete